MSVQPAGVDGNELRCFSALSLTHAHTYIQLSVTVTTMTLLTLQDMKKTKLYLLFFSKKQKQKQPQTLHFPVGRRYCIVFLAHLPLFASSLRTIESYTLQQEKVAETKHCLCQFDFQLSLFNVSHTG